MSFSNPYHNGTKIAQIAARVAKRQNSASQAGGSIPQANLFDRSIKIQRDK
jgi:hypothetical protein